MIIYVCMHFKLTSLDFPSYFLAKAADISARLSACVEDFSCPIIIRSFCLGLGVDAVLTGCFSKGCGIYYKILLLFCLNRSEHIVKLEAIIIIIAQQSYFS